MVDFTKNVVSVLTFVLFVAGTVFTGFGIFKSREMGVNQLDESFIIPSQVLNGLTVMFLLYLTSTSDFSPSYKLLVIILLVGGMMIEIYLTSYADREAESVASYIFIALNFLIRAFFLIELVQGKWVSPITQTAKPVQQAVKDSVIDPIQKAVSDVTRPLTEVISKPSVTEEKPNVDDASRELISKWDKLKNIIRAKPEGLNEETTKDAWKEVIRPAKDTGRKDVKEVLKEAVGKLTDKEGKSIPISSVDAVGGKRRS